MENWIEKENENAIKRQEERKKDGNAFLKIAEGSVKIEVNLDVKPTDSTGLNGKPRKILAVRNEGKEKLKYSLHPFLLEKLVKVLFDAGKREGWAKVTIVRVGTTATDTRYSFKEGWA